MKLSPELTREQLRLLTDAELRRRMLAATPLNLPFMALTALLYMFMPGALLGAMAGGLSVLVLAAVAAWLWLWGTPASLDSFLWFWLTWSGVSWLVAAVLSCVSGVQEYGRRRVYLAATECYSAELKPGGNLILTAEEAQEREVVVQVPEQGVYVLVCRVDDCEATVWLDADRRACMEEMEQVPGLRTELRQAFRLEAGYHVLRIKAVFPKPHSLLVMLR